MPWPSKAELSPQRGDQALDALVCRSLEPRGGLRSQSPPAVGDAECLGVALDLVNLASRRSPAPNRMRTKER